METLQESDFQYSSLHYTDLVSIYVHIYVL